MIAYRLLCAALLCGYGAAAPASRARAAVNPLTICELFDHLTRYKGKIITVIGESGPHCQDQFWPAIS
jgi:hypothetical protein